MPTHPGVDDGNRYRSLLENDLKNKPIHNLLIAKNHLCSRLVYERAPIEGASVLEMEDQKAISEMQTLLDEVLNDGKK